MNENEFFLKLTPRGAQILELVSQGLTSKDISEVLGISSRTVEVHKANIYKILGIKNSSEAIMLLAKIKNFKIGFISCANLVTHFIKSNSNLKEVSLAQSHKMICEFISKIVQDGNLTSYEVFSQDDNENPDISAFFLRKKEIVETIRIFISESSRSGAEISDHVSKIFNIDGKMTAHILEEFLKGIGENPIWIRSRQGRRGYVYSLMEEPAIDLDDNL